MEPAIESIISPMDQAPASPRLQIATPIFEGPLELLLALAEREELDILKVPLAALTEGYLAELAQLQTPDPLEMADFLWLASRLLLLKSIRLLPGEEPEPEDLDLLGWEEDVRRRLEEYRVYKEMAQNLMERAAADPFTFPAPAREVEALGQEEPLQMGALVVAFQSVLSRIPPRPVVFHGNSWTLEDKLDQIESRLARGSFELVGMLLESEDRLEAVVAFVAILELIRRGRIKISQRESFGEIWVEARPAQALGVEPQ